MKLIPTPVQVYERSMHYLSTELERKQPKHKFWTPQEVETAVTMYNAGETTKEIAKVLDRSQLGIAQKLYNILKDKELITYAATSKGLTKKTKVNGRKVAAKRN